VRGWGLAWTAPLEPAQLPARRPRRCSPPPARTQSPAPRAAASLTGPIESECSSHHDQCPSRYADAWQVCCVVYHRVALPSPDIDAGLAEALSGSDRFPSWRTRSEAVLVELDHWLPGARWLSKP